MITVLLSVLERFIFIELSLKHSWPGTYSVQCLIVCCRVLARCNGLMSCRPVWSVESKIAFPYIYYNCRPIRWNATSGPNLETRVLFRVINTPILMALGSFEVAKLATLIGWFDGVARLRLCMCGSLPEGSDLWHGSCRISLFISFLSFPPKIMS
jgi:hypothetical protein